MLGLGGPALVPPFYILAKPEGTLCLDPVYNQCYPPYKKSVLYFVTTNYPALRGPGDILYHPG